MKKCILSNRLFVPKKLVTPEMLKAYTYEMEDSSFCEGCEQNDCDNCPMTGEVIELFKEHENYYSFARGDLKKLYRIFGHLRILDDRARVPFRFNLKWRKKKELYKYQKKAIKRWLQYKYGQIKAPARTGKTVIAVNLVTRIKQKTLILAHLEELLEQFETTFRKFTNINKLEKALGYPIMGYSYSLKDFDRYDICLCTYQMFLSKKGQRKLKDYRDYFGFIITDEAHRSSAEGYAKVVGKLNPEIRLGLTATPTRKDERHVIHDHVIGPVVVEASGKPLKCRVSWVRTGYRLPPFHGAHGWTFMISRMVAEADRNRLIVDMAVKDAKNGRSILIVTSRVAHCKALAMAIDRMGISSAALWGASPDRESILDDCRKGKIKVLVAMRQIIQVGIDVPRWDTYYCTIPIANEQNFYQEMSRIRTPFKGKQKPLIRYFLDQDKAMYACQNIVTRVMQQEGFFD